jgi:hypothetical protein
MTLPPEIINQLHFRQIFLFIIYESAKTMKQQRSAVRTIFLPFLSTNGDFWLKTNIL